MCSIKPEISTKDLDQIDIRVGTIKLVEDVPKSDKLIKMTVSFGRHKGRLNKSVLHITQRVFL